MSDVNGPKGHYDVVAFLLERGAEPDKPDERGRTPLYWVAENGHQRIVKLLLESILKTGPLSHIPICVPDLQGFQISPSILQKQINSKMKITK